jgi:hypothetical protein
MKKIMLNFAVSLTVSLSQIPAMASDWPETNRVYKISSRQFLTLEMVSGTAFGILGTVIAYQTASKITGNKYSSLKSDGMSNECFCYSTLTGYTLGASFGTYLSAKLSVPTVSYMKHLCYSASCAGLGIVLMQTDNRDLKTVGIIITILGPLIAPSIYGLQKKIEYERVSYSYLPLIYDKKIIHGVALRLIL